jgi:uncharacterized protein (TIGR02246 family)
MNLAEDLAGVLKNRTEVILAGIQSRDMTEVLALFAEDALYSPSGDSLLSGRGALTAYWNSVLESPARDAVLEVLRVEPLAADAFVEIQRYEVFDAEGSRLFGGYASLLWRKIDGAWRIAADISNS